MTRRWFAKRRRPDLSSYLNLIDDFIAQRMTAPEFEKAYLNEVKDERRIIGDPIFAVLQELFEDADAHVEDPALRTDPEDLDDDQLRECAIRARRQLRELAYDD